MTATPAQGELVSRSSTAVSKKPIDEVRQLLDRMLPQIKLALPKHLDPNRLLRIVLTTIQRTPKLLECTRDSLLGCIVTCAQLGLEPDGMLGHAYLIPFWNGRKNVNECQLIVGYKGLLKLARQSGEIASISARVVHEKDQFRYQYGLNEDCFHVPTDDDEPGPVVAAYAIFRLKDGSHHFDVMTAREINRIRDNSQGYKRDKERSPWTTHYDEMAKKTALRRASKMAPASVEDKMARAAMLEHQADQGIPQTLDMSVALPPAGEDESPVGDGAPTNSNEAEGPPVEFIMSTLADRKKLSKAAKEARIDMADVVGWFKKGDIDELSKTEVELALVKIRSVTGETPREPGEDDE